MEKGILKAIGIIILFIAMIQGSIIVFNKFNCWAGIGCAGVSIIVAYILIRKQIKQNDK